MISPTEKSDLSCYPAALELPDFVKDGVIQSGEVAHILTLAITTDLSTVETQLPT
jgi:hypothetical protein